jgi:hypothetical protein
MTLADGRDAGMASCAEGRRIRSTGFYLLTDSQFIDSRDQQLDWILTQMLPDSGEGRPGWKEF